MGIQLFFYLPEAQAQQNYKKNYALFLSFLIKHMFEAHQQDCALERPLIKSHTSGSQPAEVSSKCKQQTPCPKGGMEIKSV